MTAVATRPTGHSQYETDFARYLSADTEAFSFWKGRVALYAILRALGVGEGDEVILSGFTCVVVPNAIKIAGAIPIYVDIPAGGYNMEADAVQAAITPKTKAIVIQHTFGIPADTSAFALIAGEKGIPIVEDCAHAFGSTRDGIHVGLVGNAGFFSSQWTKPYTTGLGGMAVTENPEIAKALAKVKEEFSDPSFKSSARIKVQYKLYERLFTPKLFWTAKKMLNALSKTGLFVGSVGKVEMEGGVPDDFKWRMGEFQEAQGVKKLQKAIAAIPYRKELVGWYEEKLKAAGWPLCERCDGTVFVRYPLQVANKDALLKLAADNQIELGSWFETPLHPIPLESHINFGYELGCCPVTELTAQRVVNLPVHPKVSKEEANRIVDFFIKHAERL